MKACESPAARRPQPRQRPLRKPSQKALHDSPSAERRLTTPRKVREAQMDRILVTGGAGFIGSNFVRHIYRERPDWQVTVLDAMTYAGNEANLAGLDAQRVNLVRGNVCDADLV